MSVFHFISVSGPLQEHGLNNKINRKHKFAHTNKFKHLMTILGGHGFPILYSYIEREKPRSSHFHWIIIPIEFTYKRIKGQVSE